MNSTAAVHTHTYIETFVVFHYGGINDGNWWVAHCELLFSRNLMVWMWMWESRFALLFLSWHRFSHYFGIMYGDISTFCAWPSFHWRPLGGADVNNRAMCRIIQIKLWWLPLYFWSFLPSIMFFQLSIWSVSQTSVWKIFISVFETCSHLVDSRILHLFSSFVLILPSGPGSSPPVCTLRLHPSFRYSRWRHKILVSYIILFLCFLSVN